MYVGTYAICNIGQKSLYFSTITGQVLYLQTRFIALSFNLADLQPVLAFSVFCGNVFNSLL